MVVPIYALLTQHKWQIFTSQYELFYILIGYLHTKRLLIISTSIIEMMVCIRCRVLSCPIYFTLFMAYLSSFV